MTNFARCFQIIIVTRALWNNVEVQPEIDTLTTKLVPPRISRLGSPDKRPHWNTTLDLFEPWPVKKGILILSPEAKDSGISSRESKLNAKTRFPKERDGEGKVKRKKRKKWKERKKEKRDENKEKNRRKERRIPDQRSKRSEKGKEAILDQWKKEDKNSSSQIATQNHSRLAISHPTWTKRKRPKHPASSPKTLTSRKSYWSVIVRLIFDSIGSRVQNRVMVQLWFGNRIKHLPVWVYTLWVIYFQLSPMFPLHVHLKAKSWHPTLHSRLQGRLPLAQVYCFSKIWCSREWFIFLCKKHVCFCRWKDPVDRSVLPTNIFRSPMNCVFIHVPSTFEFGAMRSDCLVQFSILNPFFFPSISSFSFFSLFLPHPFLWEIGF